MTGLRRALRLAFRMQRLELLILVGAAVLLAVAAFIVAWQTRVVRVDELACYAAAPPAAEGSFGSPCPQFDGPRQLLTNATLALGAGLLLAPFILGLFLAVPIVAREIEGRTAPLAWSLSPSRIRWLVGRAAPILVSIGLVALLLGVAGELLMRAQPWNEGLDANFDFYGSRGVLLPARALAVAGLALLVGALVPRQLGAVLLAGGLTIGFSIGLALATDRWMAEAAVPVPVDQTQGASRIYDMGFREDATGDLITMDQYYMTHPAAFNGEQEEEYPGFTMVAYVVPGSAYDTFVLRESGILLGAAIVGCLLSALVVRRRRA